VEVVLVDIVGGKGVTGMHNRHNLGRLDAEVVNAAGREPFGDSLSVCRDFTEVDKRVHDGLSDMRAAPEYFFLNYLSTLNGFERDHEGGEAHPQ
jgi:hypothetical protein